MSRRVLFCWELGDSHGHVAPYMGLLEALAGRGWSVSVALSNTAPGGRSCRDAGFRLLQAPWCRQSFSGIPSVPHSYAELLLGFGFAHADTLAGLADAWRGLLELVEPELMIASNAPSALLAARAAHLPAVRIGNGFDCPPPGERTPMTRAWTAGIDERLEKSEAHCRSTINAVLRLQGAEPVKNVPEALFGSETLLCTYPPFDYFGPRATTRYLGLLPERPAEAVDVVAYVRLEHAHTERLFEALKALRLKAMIYCPDISEAGRARWSGSGLAFSDGPLDLQDWLEKCRVVVGYAGHGMTVLALLAGRPLLLLPTHLEQQFNASAAVKLGAALMAREDERAPKLKAMLQSLLGDAQYADGARRFAEQYAGGAGEDGLKQAVAACERVAESPAAMPAMH